MSEMVAGPLLYPNLAGSANKKYSKPVKARKIAYFSTFQSLQLRICMNCPRAKIFGLIPIQKLSAAPIKNFQKLVQDYLNTFPNCFGQQALVILFQVMVTFGEFITGHVFWYTTLFWSENAWSLAIWLFWSLNEFKFHMLPCSLCLNRQNVRISC